MLSAAVGRSLRLADRFLRAVAFGKSSDCHFGKSLDSLIKRDIISAKVHISSRYRGGKFSTQQSSRAMSHCKSPPTSLIERD